ncbi:MAG: Asp23/Gls24 family envelope stress response protein [Clostridia bacterium]|nr:Asp23/Gls24 family envelope stress response protein [Clostridia bacterium]
MAQKQPKKENLPVKVDVDLSNGGTISYANEVIATIAGVAANEVDGVAGMSVSGGISDIWGRNKNITKGVKVEVGSQEAAVDLYIIVEYGKPIQKVAVEVQENVRKALEGLTGLHVVKVDVHVQGVSFEMEKKATENLLEASKKPVLEEPAEPAKTSEKPADNEDETVRDEAISEESEFDAATLEEEAKLDAAPEAEPQEEKKDAAEPKEPEDGGQNKNKKRPRVRLRS